MRGTPSKRLSASFHFDSAASRQLRLQSCWPLSKQASRLEHSRLGEYGRRAHKSTSTASSMRTLQCTSCSTHFFIKCMQSVVERPASRCAPIMFPQLSYYRQASASPSPLESVMPKRITATMCQATPALAALGPFATRGHSSPYSLARRSTTR